MQLLHKVRNQLVKLIEKILNKSKARYCVDSFA